MNLRTFETTVLLAVALAMPASGQEIPNWWLSAKAELVFADPIFWTLPILTRDKLLAQIDPKYAKMKSARRNLYLWNAETRYLPHASAPAETFAWRESDPRCSSEVVELETGSTIARSMIAGGIRVRATLERSYGFLESHIKITNERSVLTGILAIADKVIPESLSARSIPSGQAGEGNVYFESSRKVTTVTLRLFVSEVAFDIPFSVPVLP